MTMILNSRRIRMAIVVILSVAALGLVLDAAVTGTAPVGAPVNADEKFDRLFNAGVRSLRENRTWQAIDSFRRAHRIRPLVPEVHVNLGYSYLSQKKYVAAERSFRTAIDLRPNQVNAYFGWAESLEALGDLEGALGAMRTYMHLAPDGDSFKTRAMAAVWEWRETLRLKQARLAKHGSHRAPPFKDGKATTENSRKPDSKGQAQ